MTIDQPGSPLSSRENQVSAVRKKLLSPLPSDVKQGIDQIRQWLNDDPEEQDTYSLVLNIARDIPSLANEIRSLLQEMVDKKSTRAVEMLNRLNEPATTQPSDEENIVKKDVSDAQSPQDLSAQADDAYYAAEYDKAISIYQHILRREPENLQARQQLEKATLHRMASIPSSANSNLPREAVQFHRRARSYIAAKDFKLAIEFLRKAMEKAQDYGKKFPEAELFLEITQDQIVAAEYKIIADNAIQEEKWEDAVSALNQSKNFDPSDDAVKKMLDNLQGLLKAESLLDPFGMQVSTDRSHRLATIADVLKETEEIKELINTKRYKITLAKYSLYKAEADLHRWGYLAALAPQGRLLSILRASKEELFPEDPALKYVDEQLKRFKPIRIVFSVSLILITLYMLFQFFSSNFGNTPPVASSTPPPTLTPSITLTPTVTKTPTPSETVTTPIIVVATTDTPTSIVTVTPTATPIDIGYTNGSLFHPQDKPNGKWIGSLTRFQVVTILDQKVASGDQWYFIQWEVDGTPQQGWILAQFVTIGSPPTTP